MGFEPTTLATAELNVSLFYPKNTAIEWNFSAQLPKF